METHIAYLINARIDENNKVYRNKKTKKCHHIVYEMECNHTSNGTKVNNVELTTKKEKNYISTEIGIDILHVFASWNRFGIQNVRFVRFIVEYYLFLCAAIKSISAVFISFYFGLEIQSSEFCCSPPNK